MVVTTIFKEEIINLIDDALDIGELGTNSTAPSSSDIGLVSPVTATQKIISGSKSSNQILLSYNLSSVVGNGNSYSEYANFLNNDIMVNRVTFAELPKTNAVELQVTTILQII